MTKQYKEKKEGAKWYRKTKRRGWREFTPNMYRRKARQIMDTQRKLESLESYAMIMQCYDETEIVKLEKLIVKTRGMPTVNQTNKLRKDLVDKLEQFKCNNIKYDKLNINSMINIAIDRLLKSLKKKQNYGTIGDSK